ncbi:hypothetical protein SHIRM173S_11507 [Streptomyces hirsutus]
MPVANPGSELTEAAWPRAVSASGRQSATSGPSSADRRSTAYTMPPRPSYAPGPAAALRLGLVRQRLQQDGQGADGLPGERGVPVRSGQCGGVRQEQRHSAVALRESGAHRQHRPVRPGHPLQAEPVGPPALAYRAGGDLVGDPARGGEQPGRVGRDSRHRLHRQFGPGPVQRRARAPGGERGRDDPLLVVAVDLVHPGDLRPHRGHARHRQHGRQPRAVVGPDRCPRRPMGEERHVTAPQRRRLVLDQPPACLVVLGLGPQHREHPSGRARRPAATGGPTPPAGSRTDGWSGR